MKPVDFMKFVTELCHLTSTSFVVSDNFIFPYTLLEAPVTTSRFFNNLPVWLMFIELHSSYYSTNLGKTQIKEKHKFRKNTYLGKIEK